MNIAYTFNKSYIPQTMASVASVCENNDDSVTFFFITQDISNNDIIDIDKFVKKYNNKASFIPIKNVQSYFPFHINTSGWCPIVLARLLISDLIPNDINRILYLDSDTIVRGPINKLWECNLDNYILAASLEPTYSVKQKSIIGLDGIPYCNAGVLLINLDEWRKENIKYKIINFYSRWNGKLFSNDQDAINGELKGKILYLSPRYNYFNIYDLYSYRFLKNICDYSYNNIISREDFIESRRNPIIVHFLGEERPWREGNHHRFCKDYYYYLSLTPWKNTLQEKGWKLYYFFWYLFNTVFKPFPNLRYTIISHLIPKFIQFKTLIIKNV